MSADKVDEQPEAPQVVQPEAPQVVQPEVKYVSLTEFKHTIWKVEQTGNANAVDCLFKNTTLGNTCVGKRHDPRLCKDMCDEYKQVGELADKIAKLRVQHRIEIYNELGYGRAWGHCNECLFGCCGWEKGNAQDCMTECTRMKAELVTLATMCNALKTTGAYYKA